MFGFPPGPQRPRTHRIPTLFSPSQWGTCLAWLRADSQVADGRYAVPVDRSESAASITVRSSGDGQKLLAVPGTPEHLPAWWMGGAAIKAPAPASGTAPWTVVLVHGYPRRAVLGPAMTLWSFGADVAASMAALVVTATGYYQLQFGGVSPPSTSAVQQSSIVDVCIVTSNGTNFGLTLNGTQATISMVVDITSAVEGLVVGDSIGFVAPYDGMVYEVATFDSALSLADCSAINDQLQVQYRTGR